MIEEFNRAGLPAIAAPKYPGSLKDNISRHNQIIQDRTYKLFAGVCPRTEEEYETYHYPEYDGDSNDEEQDENPVDANNHLMTANMYVTQCTVHLRRQIEKKKVFVPQKTHMQKLLNREFAKASLNSSFWDQ